MLALLIAAELTVFAASSLREPFEALGRDFEAAHQGDRVVFSFAGSQELRAQLEQGAPGDVYVSADARHANALFAQGLVGRPRACAHNQLALVVPRGNPAHLKSLADLGLAERVVLADRGVPAGLYAQDLLERRGLWKAVLPHVVSRELNVRQVLTKVALGEADAGLVYQTDARQARAGQGGSHSGAGPAAVEELPLGPGATVTAEYQAARVTATKVPALADAFLALVFSAPGRARLQAAGFLP